MSEFFKQKMSKNLRKNKLKLIQIEWYLYKSLYKSLAARLVYF